MFIELVYLALFRAKKCSGQTTIETLLMLTIGIFLLATLVIIVYEQINYGYASQQQNSAELIVVTLSKEINDVYFAGPGNVKSINLTIPEGFDLNNSLISGRALLLSVNGTDHTASTKVDVRGAWPSSSGSFNFVITAYSDFVYISVIEASFSPASISETLLQSQSKSVSILFTNNSSETIVYDMSIDFPAHGSGVTLSSVDEGEVSLNSDENTSLDFEISCGANAFGSYSGTVNFSPVSGADTALSFPVSLYCAPLQKKLGLYPSDKNIFAQASVNSSDSMIVCNNSTIDFASVVVSMTGPAASFVFPESVGALLKNSCKTLLLNLVPAATFESYLGVLRVQAAGLSAESDINFIVTEGGDHSNPVVLVTDPDSGSTISSSDINFEYLVVDNNVVKECSLLIDGNTESTDSSPPFNLFSYTFSSNRVYDYAVECVDYADNVGSDSGALTVNFDETVPSVSLAGPANGYSTETARVDYNFYVSDNNAVSQCVLTVGGVDKNTKTNVTNGAYNQLSYTFTSVGVYNWDVRCTDYSSNSTTSGAPRSITYALPLSFSAAWAKNSSSIESGADSVYGNSIATDSSGNVYVAGYFNFPLNVDFNFGNSKILTSRGSNDFFVVKYDSSGVVQWVQGAVRGSGTGADVANSVVVDSSGNVYVAGYFASATLSFGGVSNDKNLTNRGGSYYDFFVVKYNSSGVAQWAQNPASGTGTNNDQANSVAVDSNGNVYVAGTFSSTSLGFSSDINFINRGGSDFFVVKYDSSGVAKWAKNPVLGSGTSTDSANSVAVDSSGNVYVAGYFASATLSFGGVSNDKNLTNRGGGDFFVVKYNSSGVAQWVMNPSTGAGAEYGYSVVVDSSGNVYVTGYFTSTSLVFSTAPNYVSLSKLDSTSYSAFFVVKYNSSGVAQWAKGSNRSARKYANDISNSVAVDSSGNVYVVGYFNYATIDFGDSKTLTNRGNEDFFVVKYNSSGTAQWVQGAASGTGIVAERANSVVANSGGDIYVAGYFGSLSLDFGNSKTLVSCNSNDFFMVKYDSSGVAQLVKNPGSGSGTGRVSVSSVAVDSSGNVYVAGSSSNTSFSFGNGVSLARRGSSDFFVVKYDSSGVAQWAQGPASGTGAGAEYGSSVVVDSSGNVYVSGNTDYLTTGPLGFGTGVTLTSRGGGDFFVVKYDSSGVAQWVQGPVSGSGSGNDYGYSVFVDSSGNVYVAGESLSSTIGFGGINNDVNLTHRGSTGNPDFFVVKYDSSGVAQWARSPVSGSGVDVDGANSVVVDSSGNVYVTGRLFYTSYGTSWGFGGVNNDINLTNRGSSDFFVVKYDSSGVAQWAKNPVSGSGTGEDSGYSVAVDSNSNVYVTGYSGSNLGFGGVGNDVNLTNRGSYDFFVVKYDSSGVAQWVQGPVSGSGTSTDYGYSVVVDSNGNVYVAGYFYSTTLSFGGVSNDKNLTNRGTTTYNDFFVVKYDSSGVAKWAQNPASGSGTNYDYGKSVAVDSSSIYIGGYFYSATLDFGNSKTLTNRSGTTYYDFFVAKYGYS